MSNQRVVLITGASSGVGQSTARLLSQKGVRSDDSVGACVKAVVGQVGQLDVVVNNAGYELARALEELSVEEAKAQFETNFFGVVRMVKAVLPIMRRQKRGQIVNVSS
jgi:NADP-dependent 3-hydroxy acid dehydrogenase YdfG